MDDRSLQSEGDKCENAVHHGWPSGLHFVQKYLYILAAYPYKTL